MTPVVILDYTHVTPVVMLDKTHILTVIRLDYTYSQWLDYYFSTGTPQNDQNQESQSFFFSWILITGSLYP